MGNLHVIDHPLVQHKLSLMRDKTTGTKDFRELLQEVATLMAYEVTRDLPLKEIEIETPIGPCRTKIIDGRMLGIIPILRGGPGHGRRHHAAGSRREGGPTSACTAIR